MVARKTNFMFYVYHRTWESFGWELRVNVAVMLPIFWDGMVFQRKWGLWSPAAFPFCVCAFMSLLPNIILLDFACQEALCCYNHSS